MSLDVNSLNSNDNLSPTSTSASTSTSRFSLILLEPGEIYFEDYLVYYYELKSPIQSKSQNQPINNSRIQKGNLKICSKSFVFDPLNLSYPLIKFPYKSIEKIELFNEDLENDKNDLDDIYSTKVSKKQSAELIALKQKCFAINTKQTICCKANNKIGAYTINKRDRPTDLHYFQFIFTNCNDSIDLLLQLHRASTLEYEQEDLMLHLILKSRLNRDKFKFDLHQLEDVLKEQIQLEAIVNKISPLVANPGKIILTNMCIYYKPFNNLHEESFSSQIFKIKLKQIKYVIKRRYHLKKVGLEIQFVNDLTTTSQQQGTIRLPYLYLTFEDEQTRDLFFNRLVIDQRDKLINLEEFSQENMLQKWRYGTISNFDYLMYLNNISDRSYNDLTQYPIFPWVLSNYTSDSLDLNERSSFRDLTKPVGALNEERLKRLKQRSIEMSASTSDSPTFLYGSHYSTPAFVLYYLVRHQPEWQLCLQNGKFDHPNRLFHSISDTWKNCLSIDSDVKELIPEFYDTSDPGLFLRNYLELDLGVRQDGTRVNHVVLPRWANNSPKEFIQKMRDALESPHVSENLHQWIDLIWGYKQRGDEAIKADNLFYYLCYEGAVDLDSIKDYSERKSLEIQIQEFGQIPTQLFKQAHLPKAKLIEINNLAMSTSNTDQNEHQELNELNELNLKLAELKTTNNSNKIIQKKKSSLVQNPNKITPQNFKNLEVKLNTKLHKSQVNDLIFIDNCTNKTNNNTIIGTDNKQTLPFLCSVSTDNWIKIYSLEDRSIFRSHNASNFSLSSVDYLQSFKKTHDDEATTSKYSSTLLFLSCWDNSVYTYDMNYNRCVYSLNDSHDDAISRIRLIQTGSSLIALTSSWDSLIKIWKTNAHSIKLQFVSELSHDSSVLAFELSESYLASICEDGNLYLWKMNKKNCSMVNSSDEDESSKEEFMTCIRISQDLDLENCFSFLYSIHSSDDIGKITDCKILESNDDNTTSSIQTLAVCTSNGLVKIFNIKTNTEIFSLKVNIPGSLQPARLNKIRYSNDYIITIDSNGYLYFIDLQQQVNSNDEMINNELLTTSISNNRQRSNSIGGSNNNSTFLTNTMKLSSNGASLQSICIYNDLIICVGDSDGNLYFLSLMDI